MNYRKFPRLIPWRVRIKKIKFTLIWTILLIAIINCYFLVSYNNSVSFNIIGNWTTADRKGNITFTVDTFRINGVKSIPDSSGAYKVSKNIAYLYKDFGEQSTDYTINFSGKDKLELIGVSNAIVLQLNRLK